MSKDAQKIPQQKKVFDMIFNSIRTEINKIDITDAIFVAFTKIEVLSNKRLHLKYLS